MTNSRLIVFALVLFVSLPVLLSGATVPLNQWSLAGHGVSRALFNGSSSSWVTKLTASDADSCFYPAFSTPFSWWSTAAGSILSDSGMLYATLYCQGDEPYTYTASLWAINAATGEQMAVQTFDNISTWDSYSRLLPDGTLAVGTSQNSVSLFDGNTLSMIGNVTGLVPGIGGAMVLGVFAPVEGRTQITSAGGDGGNDWWGAVCDIVDGHTLINCAQTVDSTVCIGADGKTAYNNQRFENPNGAVRFDLPLPSTPVPFYTNYISWPWWIRSQVNGNVVVYDGENLNLYSKEANLLWRVPNQVSYLGVMLTDDETTIVLSNQTHIATFDATTGDWMAGLSFSEAFGDDVTCGAVFSPWMNALPVLLSDSQHAVAVCGTSISTAFVSVLDLSANSKRTISFSPKTTLTVPPEQVVVDNMGNIFSFGRVRKTPTVQKIPFPSSA